MVGFITIVFLCLLRLNLPAIGDVDDLKKCAPEDLSIRNLCITISNLSLDNPLLPYEDLKLSMSYIDVDYLMGLPASEEVEKASYIDDIMAEFGPGFVHFSETQDIVMDSACDLINFYDDVDVFMPMDDVKVSPSCRSNYADGFLSSQGAFMFSKDLDLDPDPMVVDTQGSVLASPEFLRSLQNLNLEVPVELAPRVRPTRKVIRKATRARAGGRRDVKAPGINSRSSRETSFHFALFNLNEPLMNKESVLLVKLLRTFPMSYTINRSF